MTLRLPRAVDAVIFDMDGLLIDSEVGFRDAFNAELKGQGRAMPPDVYLTLIGTTYEGGGAIVREQFGADYDVDALWAACHRRLDGATTPLKAGVVELLDRLDTLDLPRAVCTSSHHRTVAKHLGSGGHDLLDRFTTVVAAGDYARGKPSPDPFLTAAARLEVPPERCLALEDSHNGVRAACAAGCMTVMVPDLLAPTTEIEGLACGVAASLHDVLAALG